MSMFQLACWRRGGVDDLAVACLSAEGLKAKADDR